MRFLVFIIFIFSNLIIHPVAAQTAPDDSVSAPINPKEKEERKLANKDANRAALMSAVVPGLGQIHNKSYWKLPIIYGGGAVLGYLIYTNKQGWNDYRNAYDIRSSGNLTGDPEFDRYTPDQIKVIRDDYRRYFQMNVLFAVGLYSLNIVDAYVDAHLKTFDVNESLSMKVKPFFYTTNYSHLASGLTVSLRLK
ncbi:MAG: DUF5683 domain-containing protein [Cytophagaceae bacterium]